MAHGGIIAAALPSMAQVATQPFPFALRTILRTSKSRSQPAAFSMSEPRRGYGYVQATGTDTPVFWDAEFRFTRQEAARFQLWFAIDLARGVNDFTLPIRTEFGLVTHTCRFLPDSLLDTREEGATFTYSATIMARAQVIPQGYLDAADLVIGLPNWELWAQLLDETVTQALPQ